MTAPSKAAAWADLQRQMRFEVEGEIVAHAWIDEDEGENKGRVFFRMQEIPRLSEADARRFAAWLSDLLGEA